MHEELCYHVDYPVYPCKNKFSRKKKSEYLAAKKEYSEKLELFEEEQKNKKSKRKKHEVVWRHTTSRDRGRLAL